MSINPDVHANQSMLVYIDSEDAEADFQSGDGAGVESDFILDLEEPILCPENQMMLASMYSCSIPYSFYDIRDNVNDKIQFHIFNIGTGLASVFDIDFGSDLAEKPYYNAMNSHGNYDVTSLSVQVNKIFTSLIRPGLIAGGYSKTTSTIEFRYLETKQRYIITFIDFPVNLVPQLQQQGEGYMDSEIGIPEDDLLVRVFAFDVATGHYFYQTPNVVDITGSTHGMFLRTNLSSNSTIASDTGRSTDILAHIPITGNQGDIIHSPPQSNLHKSRVKVKAINHIHIQLKDERNRVMDFNGLHTHIVLLIDFVYERKRIVADDSFRRQKEIFHSRVNHKIDDLQQSNQGFKGPVTIRSSSRRIPIHEPVLANSVHNPDVEIRQNKESSLEKDVEEEDDDDEMTLGIDGNQLPQQALTKDTI